MGASSSQLLGSPWRRRSNNDDDAAAEGSGANNHQDLSSAQTLKRGRSSSSRQSRKRRKNRRNKFRRKYEVDNVNENDGGGNSNADDDDDDDDDDDSDDDSDNDTRGEYEEMLHTPKRRKLTTTSKYIYQTLFLEGRDSDVTVSALNREWKLHKLYLCQSPYFSSMFSGSWKESTMDKIVITVADPRVTLDALHVALGSLYRDEISVEPADVVSILAAATLFQLEGLIAQCEAIMEETINVETVVGYYDAAQRYGVVDVVKECLAWLRINLLSHLPEYPERLRCIPASLMAVLIESPDLFVMQTEFSVYVLLRLWLFLILHPNWEGSPQEAVVMSHRFFQDRVQETKEYFLNVPEGKPYEKAFRALRFSHLINHHMDMEMLLSDRIIPKTWMYPTFLNQWQLLLRSDQGIDRGPQTMSDEEFDKHCLRCGRTLNIEGQQHMWRWTGFNMGLDLIVNFDRDTLTLKRHMSGGNSSGNNEHEALLANHKKRHVMYRVTVVSLNSQKQVHYKETSGIQSVSLSKNSVHELLKIDNVLATFPLLLSFNFAVVTPLANPAQSIDD